MSEGEEINENGHGNNIILLPFGSVNINEICIV